MTRCILHIGMHKTGSTSIQHSLHGFSDERFLYARLGDDPNHSLAMHSLFAPHPERHHLHKRDGTDAAAVSEYVAKVRADLDQAVLDAGSRTLIISGEDVSALPRDSLVRLRDDFQKRFDDVTIVGYVRAPTGLMTSSFQHRVSTGSLDQLELDRQYRSYKGTFGIFDEVFGRDRVNLWKFDIASFPEGCAVRDFCARLDIHLPPEKVVRLNESLPRHVVALLYTYYKSNLNGTSFMTGPERKNLLDCLVPISNDPFRISADVIKPILEKYGTDITWMEARLGQSLHENIGDHCAGDVRAEGDLLQPDPDVIRELLALLGERAPEGVKGESPEEVARLIHALRGIRSEDSPRAGSLSRYLSRPFAALREYLSSPENVAQTGREKKRS